MATDELWLARELQVPWFEAKAGESLEVGGGLSAPPDSQSVSDLLIHATGAPEAEVREMLRTAKARGRATGSLGGTRVILSAAAGRLSGVCLPPSKTRPDDRTAAAVSHELANALGSILGWVDIARRESQSPETRRALDNIETSGRAAEATARYFLQSASHRPRETHPVDLAQLLRQIERLAEPLVDQAGLTLETHIAAPMFVRGRRAPLFTVFWNLLKNGIQASPAGGRVVIHAERQAGRVQVRVTDSGMGITEQDGARVFEPYYTTKPSGTGLGLTLVRDAVVDLGGTISLVGGRDGACFQVALPRASPGRTNRESQVVPRSALSGLEVLVIDDDPSIRDLIATALGLAGANATVADSDREITGRFDIALIDLYLGGEERGDRVLKSLRDRGLVHRGALISGGAAPTDLEVVPDGWLRKPFELDELLDAVRTLAEASALDVASAG